MPEYLSPGVYVEEISFRKFIEGVSTSTTGIVGQTSFGPPTGKPEVLTSFADFERTYGGFDDLVYGDGTTRTNYTALAARSFFENGGQRLYAARVFKPMAEGLGTGMNADGVAVMGLAAISGTPPVPVKIVARYPGSWGSTLRVQIRPMPSPKGLGNLVVKQGGTNVLRGVYPGAVVQYGTAAQTAIDVTKLDKTAHVALVSGVLKLFDDSTKAEITTIPDFVYLFELQVLVFRGTQKAPVAVYSNLSTSPLAQNFIGSYLDPEEPGDPDAQIAMVDGVAWDDLSTFAPIQLLKFLLQANDAPIALAGGNDGAPPTDADYDGADDEIAPSGLFALDRVDEIAILLGSDAVGFDKTLHHAIYDVIIEHCENMRYRFAVLDEPQNVRSNEALEFRSKHDTTRAAIYYPWVRISDPREGREGKTMIVPPSGATAGIYARTDNARGVWKAPANEVVRDALDFELHVHKGVQDILNPAGINCLRFFEEGGFRVWGARTITVDPEWKYVNVRRLFQYIEHSIDKGTQWVVFEPNNERTWANVRHAISDFLLDVWNQGGLMGTKPEQAFFVRCDRSTMSQNDLDNGRLVCVIGVAPAYPAEFVIFRIGQWTADSKTV